MRSGPSRSGLDFCAYVPSSRPLAPRHPFPCLCFAPFFLHAHACSASSCDRAADRRRVGNGRTLLAAGGHRRGESSTALRRPRRRFNTLTRRLAGRTSNDDWATSFYPLERDGSCMRCWCESINGHDPTAHEQGSQGCHLDRTPGRLDSAWDRGMQARRAPAAVRCCVSRLDRHRLCCPGNRSTACSVLPRTPYTLACLLSRLFFYLQDALLSPSSALKCCNAMLRPA